jgi:hypothetical protein
MKDLTRRLIIEASAAVAKAASASAQIGAPQSQPVTASQPQSLISQSRHSSAAFRGCDNRDRSEGGQLRSAQPWSDGLRPKRCQRLECLRRRPAFS